MPGHHIWVPVACALVLAGLVPTSRAAAQLPEWTDEQFAAFGSNEFLLDTSIDDAIFADDELRHDLWRVGLERGCLLVSDARRSAVERHWPVLRRELVSAIRAVVPREHLMQPAIPIALSGNGDLVRVRRELDRTASAVLALAGGEARATLAAALASAPSVPAAEAAGRFADWRFDRPAAARTACRLIAAYGRRSEDAFRRAKSAFDGFYRRQGE